jgi:hypothetical protein
MKATICRAQVTSITKTDKPNPHERISHIGGLGWRFTHEQAIQGILNCQYSFFVLIEGRPLDIIIASHQGNMYLKTPIDMDQPKYLLHIPELGHAELHLAEHQY